MLSSDLVPRRWVARYTRLNRGRRAALTVTVGAASGGVAGGLAHLSSNLAGLLLLGSFLVIATLFVMGVTRLLDGHVPDARGVLAWWPPRPLRPRKWVYELATRCVICGRPLTNRRSQRARVGSTCIKKHGPRPRRVPNPAYQHWLERRQSSARVHHRDYQPLLVVGGAERLRGSQLLLQSIFAFCSWVLGFGLTAPPSP